MTSTAQTLSDSDTDEAAWRGVYMLGALFTVIVLAGLIVDIIIGNITHGDMSAIPRNAVDMFAQLQAHPLLGLYYLDSLNLLIQVCFIPVYYALYAALRKSQLPPHCSR